MAKMTATLPLRLAAKRENSFTGRPENRRFSIVECPLLRGAISIVQANQSLVLKH
jgi:hypothetical protein